MITSRSLSDPYPDIDINIRGTATVMEACRHFNPGVRVIYTGTRGQYGEATSLPVDETAPTMPKVLQEISNLTAEKITHMYHQVHQVRSVMLRLTNIYGERGQMRHSRYGVANWFIRQAIDGEEIKVFGTGEIKRDFLYIDDCIDALLMCALCDDAYGEIFNVATGDPLDFVTLAKTLVEVGADRALGVRAVLAGTRRPRAGRLLRRHQQDQADGSAGSRARRCATG